MYNARTCRYRGARTPTIGVFSSCPSRCTAYHLLTNREQDQNFAVIAHALAEGDVDQVNYKYLELAAESHKKFSKEFRRERPADGMYV
jgi:hypothetical protein